MMDILFYFAKILTKQFLKSYSYKTFSVYIISFLFYLTAFLSVIVFEFICVYIMNMFQNCINANLIFTSGSNIATNFP